MNLIDNFKESASKEVFGIELTMEEVLEKYAC